MSQYMLEKIEWIESYIKRCNEAEQKKDASQADMLVEEALSVFTPELPKMGTYLYALGDFESSIQNVRMIKAQLKNYIFNLKSGLQKHLYTDNGIHVQQTTMQHVENTVSVSITQTAECINQLPDSILSLEEKELLNGKLMSIETSPDKPTRWEKAKNALKWIAEKGIEVGIAALPYIVEALKK